MSSLEFAQYLKKAVKEEDHVEILFQGSKTFWRSRCNLDITIVSHFQMRYIELVFFDAVNGVEYPRMFVDGSKCKSKLDRVVLADRLQKHKEDLIRHKTHADTDTLMKKISRDMIVQFFLNRINMVADKNSSLDNKIELTVRNDDKVHPDQPTLLAMVFKSQPKGVVPLETHNHKIASHAEVNVALSKIEHERGELHRATVLASLSTQSVNGFKLMMAAKRQMEQEHNLILLRWKRAVRKILNLIFTEKVRERLLNSSFRDWYLLMLKRGRDQEEEERQIALARKQTIARLREQGTQLNIILHPNGGGHHHGLHGCRTSKGDGLLQHKHPLDGKFHHKQSKQDYHHSTHRGYQQQEYDEDLLYLDPELNHLRQYHKGKYDRRHHRRSTSDGVQGTSSLFDHRTTTTSSCTNSSPVAEIGRVGESGSKGRDGNSGGIASSSVLPSLGLGAPHAARPGNPSTKIARKEPGIASIGSISSVGTAGTHRASYSQPLPPPSVVSSFESRSRSHAVATGGGGATATGGVKVDDDGKSRIFLQRQRSWDDSELDEGAYHRPQTVMSAPRLRRRVVLTPDKRKGNIKSEVELYSAELNSDDLVTTQHMVQHSHTSILCTSSLPTTSSAAAAAASSATSSCSTFVPEASTATSRPETSTEFFAEALTGSSAPLVHSSPTSHVRRRIQEDPFFLKENAAKRTLQYLPPWEKAPALVGDTAGSAGAAGTLSDGGTTGRSNGNVGSSICCNKGAHRPEPSYAPGQHGPRDKEAWQQNRQSPASFGTGSNISDTLKWRSATASTSLSPIPSPSTSLSSISGNCSRQNSSLCSLGRADSVNMLNHGSRAASTVIAPTTGAKTSMPPTAAVKSTASPCSSSGNTAQGKNDSADGEGPPSLLSSFASSMCKLDQNVPVSSFAPICRR